MSGMQRSMTLSAAAGTPSLAVGIGGALAFAVLTWIGAHVYVPLEPVPVTMQTLFVLLAGSAIGTRYGALSQSIYLLAGGLGLPVFAGGAAGWAALGGPTGGYLIAFLVTPLVVARLLRASRSPFMQALAFTVGTVVIFAFGVSHLAIFYTHDLGLAVRAGLLPFIPGAFIKIAAAVAIQSGYSSFSRVWNARRGH